MKDLNMLIWLTQLGLSVAAPLVCFTWAAVWLRERFALGVWVIFVALFLGAYCAIDGFRTSLKMMEQMEKQNEKRSSRDLRNKHE